MAFLYTLYHLLCVCGGGGGLPQDDPLLICSSGLIIAIGLIKFLLLLEFYKS